MDPLKKRTLKNGKQVEVLPTPVKIEILTKCPKKWAFVDLETGQVWQHCCVDQLRQSDELLTGLRELFNKGV